jgi:hypothetical protein
MRARNIKSEEDLLALNMYYITNNGSFQMTSALMKAARGISVNKNAVYERITASGEWLRLLAQGLCQRQEACFVKPKFLGEKRVKLVDASDEVTKGKDKSTWRLHYAFDLFNFSCSSMEVTTNKEGEKLTRYAVKNDEIVIADRVYSTITGMEHVLANGGDFVLRFRHKAFTLYNEAGERIEILPQINYLNELESTEIRCYYKLATGELRPVRIVAMKKDDKSAKESLRKIKKTASKKQITFSTEATEQTEYVVLITSLDYTNEQILELYRARWQIEQVFYRLKSLFGYGDVPSKNEEAVKAWFYGKLFLAVLCETILKTECFSPKEETFMRSFGFRKPMEMP